MKRKLEMDDIRAGMYITVLRGKMSQRVYPTPNGPSVQWREKDHLNGKVLEVLSLDMPYIVVKVHEPRGSRNETIDLRETEIMRLSIDYIHKLLPKLEMSEDTFWNGVNDTSLEDAGTSVDEIFKDL